MAGLFAGMLPQVPGDPAAILRLADDLRRKSATVEEQDSSLRQVEWQLNDWEGKTVAACREALQGVKGDVAELRDGYLQGSRALEYYAWQLRATQEEILKLRRELAALDDEAARNFALRGVAGVVEIFPRVHAIQRDYNQYCRQIAKDAQDCAAQLYQGLHIEPVVLNEQNINIGRRERLTASELDRVRLELNNLDPRRMKQGKIGDCYYLASLMAVANSPQGRDFLAGCLRPHYGPDGRIAGYYVRVYENLFDARVEASTEVYVDSVYVEGADKNRSLVFALFESAYGQLHEGGTGSRWAGGITSGYGEEGLRDVTGSPDGFKIAGDQWWLTSWFTGYEEGERRQLIEALEDGHPAVASTGLAPWLNFNDDGYAPVLVEVAGEQRVIKISQGHAYMVAAADETHVTLINPWGHNDLILDGSRDVDLSDMRTGSTFRVSWGDFEKCFGDVSVGVRW